MPDFFYHRPRKRFGQHFLTDKNVIDKIIIAINPLPNDNIVEIGPGLGALTEKLADRLELLQLIEIDRDLVAQLNDRFPQLKIHNHDALKFDFQLIAERGPLRVVGNLPYNISTPLLFHLFRFRQLIQDMHFMLQEEVVDRLAAPPHNRDYGRLSVMAQYYTEVTKLFVVKPGCFSPAPKVNSAIVRLQPRARTVPADDERLLEDIVRQAFSQRRKTKKNNLKGTLGASQLEASGIDPGMRAEMLCVDDFVRLSNSVTAASSS